MFFVQGTHCPVCAKKKFILYRAKEKKEIKKGRKSNVWHIYQHNSRERKKGRKEV